MWYEGLSDEVRADFNVMRDLAVHTRIGPADRVKRLQKFIDDVNKYIYTAAAVLLLWYLYSLCLILVDDHQNEVATCAKCRRSVVTFGYVPQVFIVMPCFRVMGRMFA